MIFSAVSWVAIYFVVWWTTLFVVLPFGVRSQAEDGDVVPGSEAGAPTRTRVGRIVLMTTIVSALVFGGIVLLLTQEVFGLDDIPFLPKFQHAA
ncbi:DUF1467 family protein [Hansschlegelia plantiphila]|uniref:DUF1467 family protein n=1 Tax=Hansschlegelia plantiphila TaxID=374655 RepID=A0A9W6MX35_9HYPH|nr:DUF1467 family protein [Hansschlegelia plantiphila]GLK69505.1 hypothetical protein GCM10008179_31430 [Hansschlegelia plantiphila]